MTDIAIKALQLQESIDKRRNADALLRTAYHRYKHAAGFDFVDKADPRMAEMREATQLDYTRVQSAKAVERAAKQRLERACRRAQAEMAAGVQPRGVIKKFAGAQA
jgi:hypothetical protein